MSPAEASEVSRGRSRGAHLFVLVAGPPGSGKTTVAEPLAAELGLSLLAKDAIKEALMEALGAPPTVEASRRLGRAAVMTLLTVAKSSAGAVLDSTFYPYTVPHLRELPGPLVEVRCVCPRNVVEARYRARSALRHAGHFDTERSSAELWNTHHLTPLGLGPVIQVDTSREVDIQALAGEAMSLTSGDQPAVMVGPGSPM